jgi:hypothetical protein|tara:strand:- start:1655 stop:1912 length:258 start_codon:yes stop_codon:yes gene_type:complete
VIFQPRFTTGPFLSASIALEDLAVNFYFSYLLEEAVEKQKECEEALREAKKTQDADLIEQCEYDLAIIDRAYELSLISERYETVQ